jgi:hypothetical protein
MTISFAWMPDDVQFVKELMHKAAGKINKLRQRDNFWAYLLPGT